MLLIDKYLTRSFLVPLGYCLSGFFVIFIALDLFQNLPVFIEGQSPVSSILLYYALLLPVNLIIIAPVALVLAVLQSLSSLTKNNELTAMRASGLSMARLMRPYMIIGFLVSLGVLAINETITPNAAYWCKKFTASKKGKPLADVYTIPYKNHEARRIWFIQEYDTRDQVMRKVDVTQILDGDAGEFKLVAEEGRWLDGYLVFKDARIQRYFPDQERIETRSYDSIEMMEFTEKPSDFLNKIKPPEFMSSVQLYQHIQQKKGLPVESRINSEILLQSRLALPWTCFVATMMGIPFGNHTGRKGAFMGFALAISLFLGYFVLLQVGLWAGRLSLLPPVIAGWLPVLISLPTAFFMLYRIR